MTDAVVDARRNDASPAIDAAMPVDLSGSWSQIFQRPGVNFPSPSSLAVVGTDTYIAEDNGSFTSFVRWDGHVRTAVAQGPTQGVVIGSNANEVFFQRVNATGDFGVLNTTTATLTTIPGGIDVGQAKSVAVRGADGYLYVFNQWRINGTTYPLAAVWDGSAWSAVGSGLAGGGVQTAVALGNYIYVGGNFTSADGSPVSALAKYNTATSTWSAVAAKPSSMVQVSWILPSGNQLLVHGSGGGGFGEFAAYTPSTGVWGPLNLGPAADVPGATSDLSTITIANGTIYGIVGSTADHDERIYKFANGTWSRECVLTNLNNFGVDTYRNMFAGTSDGRVIASAYAGQMLRGGTEIAGEVEVVNDTCHSLGEGLVPATWTTTNTDPAEVLSIIPTQAGVYAAGLFDGGDGLKAQGVVRFDMQVSRWRSVGQGLNGRVRAVTALPNGSLLATGDFSADGAAVAMSKLALFDGSSWSPVGQGLDGNGRALYADGAGLVYIAGQFVTADTTSANRIVEWNGSTFAALGTGVGGSGVVVASAILPSADGVYVGGAFATAGGMQTPNVARWSETTRSWSAMGDGLNGPVNSLVIYGGHVCAGGDFTSSGSTPAHYIACWDGTAWNPLPIELDGSVSALAAGDDGQLYAVGAFGQAGIFPAPGFAAWDGNAWRIPASGPPGVPRSVYEGSGHIWIGSESTTGIARFDAN